jgi:hypothetical protein
MRRLELSTKVGLFEFSRSSLVEVTGWHRGSMNRAFQPRQPQSCGRYGGWGQPTQSQEVTSISGLGPGEREWRQRQDVQIE